MNKEIAIQTHNGERAITQDRLFIISEVGNQFNGDLETARKLAQVAKDAGADAVKYIFWFPDEIMADEGREYTYETSEGEKTENMFDLLNRLRLTLPEWVEVKEYCDNLDIIMTTTVNCFGAWEWAMDLGLPLLKLSTWDWNFTDLWAWSARTMLPCIADLGAVNEGEIDRNVNIFKEEKNPNLILLHCFHTGNYNEMNMRTIPFIHEKFDCLTGYSSANYNDETDIMAVALGACVLEKRLTLDRKGGVLHDAVSKEPGEFQQYVEMMRKLKQAVGKFDIIPSQKDLEERKKWFRHIVAETDIAIGDTITRDMLGAKRGEAGISPQFIWPLCGKRSRRQIRRNDRLWPGDICGLAKFLRERKGNAK